MSLDDWCMDEFRENEAAARRLAEAEARRENQREFMVLALSVILGGLLILGLVIATGMFFKWLQSGEVARDAEARAEGWRSECGVLSAEC